MVAPLFQSRAAFGKVPAMRGRHKTPNKQDGQMKQGQAWLGTAILAAGAIFGTAALGQTTNPGEKLDSKEIGGLSADATISRNQDRERDPNRGPVTNLPLPRYVSLKGDEGNARRGPSLSHRIDWVFRHAGMPLRVVAEFGQWRRVEDQDGAGGWVHYSLLSGVRTAIVTRDMLDLLSRPEPRANVIARAEAGAIVRLHECNIDWCRVSGGGEKGWVPKTAIWGVDADEIRD
ncbi:SH3 domain-containing protein [Paracoccus kondratievae]|uniref:SH3 domain-containing protein n=1 Tax=Paracoccus kondratievae TaxID=135740 RepID=UPI0029D40DEB|nr:SH3 domain-containing protein [Paracoccus kondratievae]